MLMTLVCVLTMQLSADDQKLKVEIDVAVGRQDSAIEVLVEDGASVLDVTSKFGIDTATITRRGDSWPEKIVVRLHLSGLESFRAIAGETAIEWSVAADGKARVTLLSGGKETPVAADSEFHGQARVVGGDGTLPLKDGHFEIRLPAKLLEKNPRQFKLRWIDFYRG